MAEIKLKNGARLELHIAIGRDRFEKKWKNKTVTWTELPPNTAIWAKTGNRK